MFCKNHPDRIAIIKCHHCGKLICDDCQVLVKGIVFCAGCSDFNMPGVKFVPNRDVMVAGVLSLILPGAGQAYNGQFVKGFFILLSSWLILPWIYGIYDAVIVAGKLNRREMATELSFERLIVFVVLAAIFLLVFFRVVNHLSKRDYAQDLTQKNLFMLSRAMEDYNFDHGTYPQKILSLYSSDPPYLEELYCDIEVSGYIYICDLKEDGYTITAISLEEEDENSPHFRIETGGVFKASKEFWTQKEEAIKAGKLKWLK